jgi:hypothetical protein
MKSEPALWTGLVVAVLGIAFHALDIPALDTDTAEALASALVTLVGALVVRAKVMPVATIKEAGLDPELVQLQADDPNVLPHRSP